MFPLGDAWIQEDNARPHKAKVAATFREENFLSTLPWPAQSPDLNPIENLWAVVKSRLSKQRKKPSNLAQLERRVQKIWKAIPNSLLEKLVDSMPDRVNAVIAVGGGPTKY
jgi:transposase